jgi:hypothetical protein
VEVETSAGVPCPARDDLDPVYRAALATCQPASIPFQQELLFSTASSASSPLCSLVSTIETDAGRPIQEFRPSSAAARIEQSGPAQPPRLLHKDVAKFVRSISLCQSEPASPNSNTGHETRRRWTSNELASGNIPD